jgi:Zn-dependent peptidase ImmA (M78 family)/DNA-binding XRE family transcriptional regulator
MRPGTPGFAAGRLTEAREARAMTMLGLAELIDVSKQVVSKYESGERTPSPEVLLRIAAVLRFPPEFFTLPERPTTDAAIFYRSLAAATKAARTRGARRIDWLADIATFVGGYIEFPAVSIPQVTEHPEDAALALREAWGLGELPLGNVVWLLETKGAVVTRGFIDANTIDAFSSWHSIGRPLMFLASDKASAVRSRFDAAHELGHMVMHRDVRRREFAKGEHFKDLEQQANLFASALLMPATTFMADLWNPGLDSMRVLKQKWGASIAAMISRSKQLGIISDDDAQRFRISAARRGWSRREPMDDLLPAEEPTFLRRSIELLVEQGVMPRDSIVGILTLSPSDIEALANLPTGYLVANEAPVRLLDRAVPGSGNDDGIRGAVVPFRPKAPGASEPRPPA